MSFVDYHNLAAGVIMTSVTHPLSYCKVLIQLGHEPLTPVIRRNIFFRKRLQYPNIFQYMKHIKGQDGFLGLYRGLPYRILAHLSTTITYHGVSQCIESNRKSIDKAGADEDGHASVRKFTQDTCQEMAAKCCAIVVSHPFHVIAIRSMAQFVGHETYYNGIFSSIKEIYEEEGILGFFAGLIPRIAAEIAHIWICNLLAHIINTYALSDDTDLSELRQYTRAVTSYVAGVVTYPVTLTSTIMAVSGSRLSAGRPPHMPCYVGWLSCLKDLRKKGLSNRGSSIYFRAVLRYAVQATEVTPMPPPPIPK